MVLYPTIPPRFPQISLILSFQIIYICMIVMLQNIFTRRITFNIIWKIFPLSYPSFSSCPEEGKGRQQECLIMRSVLVASWVKHSYTMMYIYRKISLLFVYFSNSGKIMHFCKFSALITGKKFPLPREEGGGQLDDGQDGDVGQDSA